MARNPYIRDVNSEQKLVEDLTIETIKSMGRNMVYIPRKLQSEDDLFGEDVNSKFDDVYDLEMYILNVSGFEGEGDIIAKYGLEIKDRATFVVARKRFTDEVTEADGSIDRPREGDLIYFPLTKALLEINFVEHENPFYQLGSLYTFTLVCETFTYNNEKFDTGIEDLDDIFKDRRKKTRSLVLTGSPIAEGSTGRTASNYFQGEVLFQVAGQQGDTFSNASATADIVDWDANSKTLLITNISGNLLYTSNTESVKGASSGAEYLITTDATADIIIQHNIEDNEFFGDNESIELEGNIDNIIDFSDSDPFSEGNF
tara:strand:- start:41533 stop:42477 length:945 start_codon:yes stop_codon:yes gene_type:complete